MSAHVTLTVDVDPHAYVFASDNHAGEAQHKLLTNLQQAAAHKSTFDMAFWTHAYKIICCGPNMCCLAFSN